MSSIKKKKNSAWDCAWNAEKLQNLHMCQKNGRNRGAKLFFFWLKVQNMRKAIVQAISGKMNNHNQNHFSIMSLMWINISKLRENKIFFKFYVFYIFFRILKKGLEYQKIELRFSQTFNLKTIFKNEVERFKINNFWTKPTSSPPPPSLSFPRDNRR